MNNSIYQIYETGDVLGHFPICELYNYTNSLQAFMHSDFGQEIYTDLFLYLRYKYVYDFASNRILKNDIQLNTIYNIYFVKWAYYE